MGPLEVARRVGGTVLGGYAASVALASSSR